MIGIQRWEMKGVRTGPDQFDWATEMRQQIDGTYVLYTDHAERERLWKEHAGLSAMASMVGIGRLTEENQKRLKELRIALGLEGSALAAAEPIKKELAALRSELESADAITLEFKKRESAALAELKTFRAALAEYRAIPMSYAEEEIGKAWAIWARLSDSIE